MSKYVSIFILTLFSFQSFGQFQSIECFDCETPHADDTSFYGIKIYQGTDTSQVRSPFTIDIDYPEAVEISNLWGESGRISVSATAFDDVWEITDTLLACRCVTPDMWLQNISKQGDSIFIDFGDGVRDTFVSNQFRNYDGAEGVWENQDSIFELGEPGTDNKPYITTDRYLNFGEYDDNPKTLYFEVYRESVDKLTHYPVIFRNITNNATGDIGIKFVQQDTAGNTYETKMDQTSELFFIQTDSLFRVDAQSLVYRSFSDYLLDVFDDLTLRADSTIHIRTPRIEQSLKVDSGFVLMNIGTGGEAEWVDLDLPSTENDTTISCDTTYVSCDTTLTNCSDTTLTNCDTVLQNCTDTTVTYGSTFDSLYASGRKVKITIDETYIDSDLTSWEAKIQEDELPDEMFDSDGTYPARSDGADVRFTSDAAGTSELARHIRHFNIDANPANGTADIVVNIGSVTSSAPTEIWVWYHDPDRTEPVASSTYGAENAYNASTELSYSFNESSGNAIDGTANTHDGTLFNTPTQGATGIIHNAYSFNASNNEYVSPQETVTPVGSYSYGGWIKTSGTGSNMALMDERDVGFDGTWARVNSDGTLRADVSADGGTRLIVNGAVDVTDNAWHYWYVTWDGTTLSIYVDGVLDNSGSDATISNDVTDIFAIARRSGGETGSVETGTGKLPYDGDMDDQSVQAGARSADEVKADYHSIQTSAFYTVGTPQSPDAPDSTFIGCDTVLQNCDTTFIGCDTTLSNCIVDTITCDTTITEGTGSGSIIIEDAGSTLGQLDTLNLAGDVTVNYTAANNHATVSVSDDQGFDTIQVVDDTLQLSLERENALHEIDLKPYIDNTDNQTVDTFTIDGTTITLALESDGEAPYTISLSGWDTDASDDITTSTTLGGDLDGTLPNPDVDGVLGFPITGTPDTDELIIKWDSTNNQWTLAPDATSGGGTSDGVATSGTVDEPNQEIDITVTGGSNFSIDISDIAFASELFGGVEVRADGTSIRSDVDDMDFIYPLLAEDAGAGAVDIKSEAFHGLGNSDDGTTFQWELQTDIGTNQSFGVKEGTNITITESTAGIYEIASSAGTDDQTIDEFSLSGSTLSLSLENDGEAAQTVTFTGWDTDDTDDITTSTTAGGDLGGTYPNPTVEGIDNLALPAGAPSDNQIIKFDASSGAWAYEADASGSGGTDDQQIETFDLTGTTLTLAIENDGQADQTVDFTNWDTDDTDDITTSTSAGGDLSGTYPDPSVAGIDGISLPAGSPTDNQIIKYDAGTGNWAYEADASGSGGTDDQQIETFSLSGTTLTLAIEDDGQADQTVSFSGWDTNVADDLTEEDVEDLAGGMFSGNTETLITATYQDIDGTIDLIVNNDLSLYDNSSSGFLTSEVDGSTTNEIQTITSSTNGSGADINLDLGGGTVTLAAGTDISISESGNTITINSTAGGGTSPWETGTGVVYEDDDNVVIGATTTSNLFEVSDVAEFASGGDITFNDYDVARNDTWSDDIDNFAYFDSDGGLKRAWHLSMEIRVVTTNLDFTPAIDDQTVVIDNSSSIDVDLPSGQNFHGKTYIIINQTAGSDVVVKDGATTLATLNASGYRSVWVQYHYAAAPGDRYWERIAAFGE